MNEGTLQKSLDAYRAKLDEVKQIITTVGETEDLKTLLSDLTEIITLTEGSLLSLKKSKLLMTLEGAESQSASQSRPPSHSETAVAQPQLANSIDDEYAAFQAALQEDLEPTTEDNSNHFTASSSSAVAEESKRAFSVHSSGLAVAPDRLSGPSNSDYTSGSQTNANVDNETSSSSSSSDSSDDERDDNAKEGGTLVDDELSKLIGMKCCAPFSHDWGKLDYHNALVMSAHRDAQTDKIFVKVMYTTPTHNSMRPCKFFMEGHCRFTDDKCRYSHGETVELEKLREFVEADHSTVAVDTKCLACYKDGIWYPATVTDVKEDVVSVHFDDYGEDMELDMTQIVPAVTQTNTADSSSEDEEDKTGKIISQSMEGKQLQSDSEEEEEELPVFLWQPPKTTDALGEWEAHTRGIGSKLMSKMGYIPGQGLGVKGQGKAEPVPIMLLPQGKSLDRIMELKEMAGNEDLFNAMKRLERNKRRQEKKREQEAASGDGGHTSSQPQANVFDFINNRLAGKRDDLTALSKTKGHKPKDGDDSKTDQKNRNISEHELHKRTDRDINLQVFKTHEEIRNVERHIERLREQLARNENKDRRMAGQVRATLAERETYLASLRASSSALDKHKTRRTHSKKLTVF